MPPAWQQSKIAAKRDANQQQVWSEVSSAAGAAGRIAEILEVEPKVKAPAHPTPMPQPPPLTQTAEHELNKYVSHRRRVLQSAT